MGIDTTPIDHDWEALLDQHVVIVKSALATNDFGAVDEFIENEKKSGIDHTAIFKHFLESNHLDPELNEYPDQIKELNADAVDEGRAAYNDFSSTVANLQDTPPKNRSGS